MPKCKNCNNRIDRFNKDRCPICGVEHPFDGVSSDTIEITTNIDVDSVDTDYKPCRKKTLLFYFCLLGIFGVPFFYLRKFKDGVIQLVASAIAIGIMSFFLAVYTPLGNLYGILLAFGIMYALNIIFGLVYISQPNLKDGRGEFVI